MMVVADSVEYTPMDPILSIEAELQVQLPGLWRKLDAQEINNIGRKAVKGASAGWKIDLPKGFVQCPDVNFFLIVIDAQFPLSQPRILAPEAFRDFVWPHVEAEGLLCLNATLSNGDPGQRIMRHIIWAQELLNFSAEKNRTEFEREFSSYWFHKASISYTVASVLSLLAPTAKSREIVWFYDLSNKRFVIADDKASLLLWLSNAGVNPSEKSIHSSWLEWLPRPWIPSEFPQHGKDVLSYVPSEIVNANLRPGRPFPVIFGAETVSGVVFVATILQSISESKLTKGFRNISKVPKGNIVNSFASQKAFRYPVHRVDSAWIHGRDHDPMHPYISKRKIVIVGCGALGGSIARLLAESGISEFTLIDNDFLTSHNTSRHALGLEYLLMNKAFGTAQMLMRSFPHIKKAQDIQKKFEYLSPEQLNYLSNCDVVISCGVSYEGDAKIDNWRQSLKSPPAHICCWAEEFAIVGHAVGLLGNDSLLAAFDEEQRVKFRLTEWPTESEALIVEAGCGNTFQPHGAVDLQATVSLAARMALDIISNELTQSTRRVWMGSKGEVTKRGGHILGAFTDNLCVKEFPWS